MESDSKTPKKSVTFSQAYLISTWYDMAHARQFGPSGDARASNQEWDVVNSATPTSDPGSVSFISQYEAKTAAMSKSRLGALMDTFKIHPSVYAADFARGSFRQLRLRVTLFISPFHLGTSSSLNEGVAIALSELMRGYRESIGGRLLSYSNLQLDSTARSNGRFLSPCIHELRGLVPVNVVADFVAFAPRLRSNVFVEIRSLDVSTGSAIGTVLGLATVRFDLASVFGKFMRRLGEVWVFGFGLSMTTLEAHDVFSAIVTNVGKEDEALGLMNIEIEAGADMTVISQATGKKTLLKEQADVTSKSKSSSEDKAKKKRKTE